MVASHSAHTISISIHVLREEDDENILTLAKLYDNFYPRPPRGGRLADRRFHIFAHAFLSTSSARRTTGDNLDRIRALRISIHVLREEDDKRAQWRAARERNFYPRPPRGGRPHGQNNIWRPMYSFLSTSSARRTTTITQGLQYVYQFLSTSSARRTTRGIKDTTGQPIFHFYPRPPRGGRPVTQIL